MGGGGLVVILLFDEIFGHIFKGLTKFKLSVIDQLV